MKTKDMLFDASPIEDEDTKKKRPSKRRKPEEPVFHSAPVEYEFKPFVMTLVDVAVCERCGSTVTDLADIVKADGVTKWRVICGWSCGLIWLAEPVPGVLDEADKSSKQFVLREGRFAGKTLDEVWDSGNEWYVRDLATMAKRTVVAAAATEWLAKKEID